MLGDIRQGWRSEKIINSPIPTSDMTSTPIFPADITPTTDNVQLDIDSDSEAEQAALELTQALECVCAANKAREKHWEDQKRQEEERKAKIIVAMKLAAEQAAELAVDRERRMLLQVSLEFLQLFH